VLAYITVHTKSLFLSTTGMFQVIAIFIPGVLIYYKIFFIGYFSSLQVLVVFVIIGIAAGIDKQIGE
jgi:hypothetical protein